ncbi:MAG: tetratricopeptide repeat protein [Gammaproteobacteria bacterium]|nr:MAG: tetratricopeptide repeat protein [Gammaproteobacteria bacterium]
MSGDKQGSGGILRELQRRNVFKVAMVYLIAAWVLIQVAETTFPALQLPDWTVTFVVVVLAILFPIAVIFAWAFELTPEGLKKTREVDPVESITSTTGQRINFLIIGVLAVAVVVLITTHGGLSGKKDTPSADSATESKSIAVLPFVNMSGDADNEYFSDGLSEELLNVLAQVDGLRVAARTSSFHFKGQNEDLRTVGDKLGVEHVLEGSVRKSGNRIRVTAQLIKVEDGFHLWSDTYDHEMDDVFRIQDEISLAVVDALRVNLLGADRQRITKRATSNVEAHNLYLRGRQFLHLRTLDSIEQAEKLFEQAVRMDPNYALAYSGLSDATNLLASNHELMPEETAYERTAPLLERAMGLDPESAEVWASRGLAEMNINNLDEAEAALQRSMELNPSYAPAYLWYASAVSQTPGRTEEAIEVLRKTLEIDPLSRVAQNNIAANYLELGRYDDAATQWRRLVTLDPDYPTGYLGLYRLNRGYFFKLDEAHRWLLKGHEVSERDVRNTIEFVFLYSDLGMPEDAQRWTRRIMLESPNHPLARMLPVFNAVYEKDFALADQIATPLMDTDLSNFGGLRATRILSLVMLDRTAEALDLAKTWYPDLLSEDPVVTTSNHAISTEVMFALARAGDRDKARRLLAAEEAHQATDHRDRTSAEAAVIMSVNAAAAGEHQRAISLLREGVDQGWLGSAEWSWKFTDSEYLGDAASSPEVRALQDRLDAAIADQRQKVRQQLAELGAGARF